MRLRPQAITAGNGKKCTRASTGQLWQCSLAVVFLSETPHLATELAIRSYLPLTHTPPLVGRNSPGRRGVSGPAGGSQ